MHIIDSVIISFVDARDPRDAPHRGVFPVPIAFAKKFCAPHATTSVFSLRKIEEKRGKAENFDF